MVPTLAFLTSQPKIIAEFSKYEAKTMRKTLILSLAPAAVVKPSVRPPAHAKHAQSNLLFGSEQPSHPKPHVEQHYHNLKCAKIGKVVFTAPLPSSAAGFGLDFVIVTHFISFQPFRFASIWPGGSWGAWVGGAGGPEAPPPLSNLHITNKNVLYVNMFEN